MRLICKTAQRYGEDVLLRFLPRLELAFQENGSTFRRMAEGIRQQDGDDFSAPPCIIHPHNPPQVPAELHQQHSR